MRVSTLKALVVRDLIVALLCAVLALGSLASARAYGSKASHALDGAHLGLCLPSGNSGSGEVPAGHDCDSCCLPMSTSLGRLPEPMQVQASLGERIRIPSRQGQSVQPSPNLPWSRGPPVLG